jgi:hypothetical protein
MKYKVGDKVKFLNERGGGIVSKIVSPGMVNVTIEDGFEIPVMISELIKIEIEAPVDSPKHMFREDYQVDIPQPETPIYEEDERNIKLSFNKSKGSVDEGIYLAFVPHDQKWLITGMIDIYLVNHTEFDILYSVYLEKENGGFSGFDYGSVNPSSMVLLETTEREKIGKWEKGVIQVLFHTDESHEVISPGTSDFKLKLPRFYVESSYNESSIISGKALLLSLMQQSAFKVQKKSDAREKEDGEPPVEKAKEIEPVNIIDKHKTSPREAVVDLHIYELVENEAELEPKEILNIQINYFVRCLENAIANKLSKVTFIHGVGTGVLKTALKEILKDYNNTEYRDASMKQFGYGAMEVLIR